MATLFTFQSLQNYIQQEGWERHLKEKESMILSGWKGKAKSFKLLLYLDQTKDILVFYVPDILKCPKERREVMGRALLMANADIILGKFAMEDNGNVSFGITLLIEDAMLTYDQFKHCLTSLTIGTEHYYSLLQQLAESDLSFEKALELWRENTKKEGGSFSMQ